MSLAICQGHVLLKNPHSISPIICTILVISIVVALVAAGFLPWERSRMPLWIDGV